jgi:hypothetical protein
MSSAQADAAPGVFESPSDTTELWRRYNEVLPGLELSLEYGEGADFGDKWFAKFVLYFVSFEFLQGGL